MIQGEKYLAGLEKLDLQIIEMKGWTRAMRWPQTQRTWVATSPNIPTFESALVYAGIGFVGETDTSEGRGTPTPFSLFGAPWFNAAPAVARLNALRLPGAKFTAERYTPRSIPGVAEAPRFVGKAIDGVRVAVTDVATYQPLEVGMHALAMLATAAKAQAVEGFFNNLPMFNALAGTRRLYSMLSDGRDGTAIIAAWQREVADFKARRARYLLY
jgi:uncharacterized protein YbbC (DUF1343 family)